MTEITLVQHLEDFMGNPALLALSLPAAAWARKGFEVPRGATVLRRGDDGRTELIPAGAAYAHAEGVDALLVKTDPLTLALKVGDLRAADGLSLAAELELELQAPPQPVGLDLLRRHLVRHLAQFELGLLAERLAPALEEVLRAGLATTSADALETLPGDVGWRERLQAAATQALFGTGLICAGVRRLAVVSEELERLRHIRLEALAAKMQREGLLEEQAFSAQQVKERHQRGLSQFDEIKSRMGDDDLKALVFMLKDERLKKELLESLIEKDMSAKQIAARRAKAHHDELAGRMAELEAVLAGKGGAGSLRGGPRLEAVYVVGAAQVLAYGRSPRGDVVQRGQWSFEGGPLGLLRSVRLCQDDEEGECLLVGAQGGVYLQSLKPGRPWRPFPFGQNRVFRGGVNAAAAFGQAIYATHSEQGLYTWDRVAGGAGTALCAAHTDPQRSTRGCLIDARGRLIFSSGEQLYALDLVRIGEDPQSYPGARQSITALAVHGDELIAGTKGGELLSWTLGQPQSVQPLPLHGTGAVTMLRVAVIGGRPVLLVAAKEFRVAARALDGQAAIDFESPKALRWCDGAADLVFAVDRSGRALIYWEVDRPSRPAGEIHLGVEATDILVQTTDAAGGEA